MADNSYGGLFNSDISNTLVRKYQDLDFARMFSLITKKQGYVPGVYNELKVSQVEDGSMKVEVDTGAAWVGDPAGWCFINYMSFGLKIDELSGANQRTDEVVLRLNRNTAKLSFELLVIKEGSKDPFMQENLLDEGHIYDMRLAYVTVNNGISTLEIQDARIPCINTQSTTIQKTASWTLGLTDIHKFIRVNSVTDVAVTVPLNSEVAFPIDTEIVIVQHGAGEVNINAASGVTVRSYNGLKSAGQYSGFTLRKVDTDEWYVLGSLTNA